MSRVRLDLLGGMSVLLDGQEITFSTRKAAALLGFLGHERARRSRARLADLLWSRSGGEQGRQSLRQALFAIRKSLGRLDPFEIVDEQIRINRSVVDCDAVEFLEAVGAGAFERAQELYQGEFLEGFEIDEPPFDHWLAARRTEIREAAIQLFSDLLDQQYDALEDGKAIRTALILLEVDPLQEEAHRKLMRLYNRQGRINEALRQYRSFTELLRSQMHVEPQPETRQVQEEILTGRMQPVRKESESSPACVLVVEDNPLQRKLISRMLNEEGYRVVAVENGADALLEMGRSQCDLVLLDLNLPMLDGLNVLETVRRRDVPTPVILISAEPPEEVESKALGLGAADFIRKPVQKEALSLRIERALRLSRAEEELLVGSVQSL